DPLLVRGGEAERDLDGVLDRPTRRERARGEGAAERLALEELHDGVRDAALAPDVVEREDVRVRERGNRLRLALETRERLRILGHPLRQTLDGDVAAEPRVARAVDLAHPSRSQRREDLVGAESSSYPQSHFSPLMTNSVDSQRRY